MADIDVDILERVYDIVGHKFEGIYEMPKSKQAIVEERTVECIIEELLDTIDAKEEEIEELSKSEEERHEDYLWQEADNYNDDAKLGLR